MLFNAAMTMANGGTIGQVLKGAAIGAVVGAIGNGLGNMIGDAAGIVGNVVKLAESNARAFVALSAGQMIAGGLYAKASGGKFADGVKGAAIAMGLKGIGKAIRGDFDKADPVSDALKYLKNRKLLEKSMLRRKSMVLKYKPLMEDLFLSMKQILYFGIRVTQTIL